MPATSFVGLDPERLDAFASELRTQSTVLDEIHRDARTALALAELTDPNLLRRLADRADRFVRIAAELNERAQMIRHFSIDFPSQAAAEAARAQVLAGLVSFDTIDELQDKVDNWSGSDNDPILDNLIRRLHEARADDDTYRALWAEWAAEQVALADAELAADQALVEVRALLRVDNQSGWTPWHDGDAEVTSDDAADAMMILAALDPVAVAMVVDQLAQDELLRLADGLAGNATHADKPWAHWAWSPIQAPVRETKHWMGEAADAGSHLYTGIAEGFHAMATQQGGPSPYNPYTAEHVQDHFTESHQIVLEGSIPLLSNGARCVEGDGWSCVGLGAEVALWVTGELVGGVIVATIATTPAMVLVRVRLRDGTERVATIINQRIRHTAGDVALDVAEESIEELADLSMRGLVPASGTRIRPPDIPDTWRATSTRGDAGVWFYDPKNRGNAVRVMQGNPNSPYPNSQRPYVRWQANGQPLDKNGDVLPSKHSLEAHIPLDKFRFIPEVFAQ